MLLLCFVFFVSVLDAAATGVGQPICAATTSVESLRCANEPWCRVAQMGSDFKLGRERDLAYQTH